MGGLAPVGSGLNQPKNPIVVVHSKTGDATVKKTMVGPKEAAKLKAKYAAGGEVGAAAERAPNDMAKKHSHKQKTKKVQYHALKKKSRHHPLQKKTRHHPLQKKTRHKRRLLAEENDADIEYRYNKPRYNRISRCKILDSIDDNNAYEICVNYDLDTYMFSLDVKSVENKALRGIERAGLFRDAMDYNVIKGDKIKNVFGDNYVAFEPIRGNLGYAIYRYELMDWHSFPGDKYKKYKKYGEFDHFDHYIHYFSEMEFIYDKYSNDYCSGWIYDLPFKLCLNVNDNHIIVYFEKYNDVIDNGMYMN
eukprot:479366_1